jgi:hypothetical protein
MQGSVKGIEGVKKGFVWTERQPLGSVKVEERSFYAISPQGFGRLVSADSRSNLGPESALSSRSRPFF